MSSKKCYARFKIFKDDLNIEKYEIIFWIKDRKLSTKKMQLKDGISIDAAAALYSNETIKNCNAFVNFYKSNKLLNLKPLLLRVSDNSLKDERNYLKRARIPVTEESYFDYLYTTFSFSVTKSNTNVNPNSKKTQTIQSINNAPSIPYGLRWVGFLRKQIKLAALKNNVNKLAIASIIFQEKYHGIYARVC